jgi:endonuclease/exonuclease/phosphatase family metal-dependent hydrolase
MLCILSAVCVITLSGCRNNVGIVRVMTYNLHHCMGDDGIYDVSRIAEFMITHQADIILCQEVDSAYSDRSKMEKQPEMLETMLGFHAFYGPNIGETYGNLILSRYPIASTENISLPNPDDIEPRGVIVATLKAGKNTITIMDTHLSAFSRHNRDVEVEFLKGIVKERDGLVLFGADFNCRPSGQLKPLLDDGVVADTRDGVLGLGEGIDDILVSIPLRDCVIKGEIVENQLSDHPAYWIDIDFGKLKVRRNK